MDGGGLSGMGRVGSHYSLSEELGGDDFSNDLARLRIERKRPFSDLRVDVRSLEVHDAQQHDHSSPYTASPAGGGGGSRWGLDTLVSFARNSSFEPHPMVAEAWDAITKSVVYMRWQPVGTVAATDHASEEVLNYEQKELRLTRFALLVGDYANLETEATTGEQAEEVRLRVIDALNVNEALLGQGTAAAGVVSQSIPTAATTAATEASKLHLTIILALFSAILVVFGFSIDTLHSQLAAARFLSRVAIFFQCAALAAVAALLHGFISRPGHPHTNMTGLTYVVGGLWSISFLLTAAAYLA